MIEKKLKKDHYISHQFDEAQKKRMRILVGNNDMRFNREIRNRPIIVVRANNNNRHHGNNNQNDNDILNGIINLLGHGMEFNVNNQRERNNNRFNNRNNNRNNNRSNSLEYQRNPNHPNGNNDIFNNGRMFNPLGRQQFIVRIFGGGGRNRGKHVLNNFPEIVIEDVNKLGEDNKKCVICLEEFTPKEKVTSLPCIHLFHTPCIKNWIKNNNTCPICKFELTAENLKQKMDENIS